MFHFQPYLNNMAYLLKIHSSPFLSVAVETNITALFAATKLFLLLLNLILNVFLISYHLVMYPVLRLNQLLMLSCSCQYLYIEISPSFPHIELFHIYLFHVLYLQNYFPIQIVLLFRIIFIALFFPSAL